MAGDAESAAMAALSIGEDVSTMSDEQNLRSPYTEQPLQPGEIRLLTIDAITTPTDCPSTAEETGAEPTEVALHLTTTRASLADRPAFDAVSYVWGAAPASVVVQCNDAPLLVTPTAYEMLQHLRLYRLNVDRPIWIDAICINQNASEEKSHQVQQMSKVFSRATSVIVWMGPSNPYIRAFMEDFPRVLDLSRNWKPTIWTYDPMWRGADWPGHHDDFWVGLYYLLDHDWFRRLWTYQEFVLAQNVVLICGTFRIDAIAFSNFVADGHFDLNGYLHYDEDLASRLATKPTSSSLAFAACNFLNRGRNYYSNSVSGYTALYIPSLLSFLRNLRTKEPVDKVWAIAGSLDGHLQDKLAPMVDYSDEGRKEYWKTYVNFAKTLLEVGQSLDLLVMPPTVERLSQNLPSWCVDLLGRYACRFLIDGNWNVPIEVRPSRFALVLFDDNDTQKSLNRRQAIVNHPMRCISVSEPSNVLGARGFILDTISEVVEDVTLRGHEIYALSSTWEDWTSKNPLHAGAMNVLSRALALARRILLGGEHLSATPLPYLMCIWIDCRIVEDTERAYNDAWKVLNNGGHEFFALLEPSRRDRTYYSMRRLLGLTGHSFFATEGGRFGLAHPGCRPGDKVCTFYGGEPLYILRWPEIEKTSNNIHSDRPATYCGAAFIPRLMEQHERDAARLGPDENFHIK